MTTGKAVAVFVLIALALAGASAAQAQCQGPEIAKLTDTEPGMQHFYGQSVAIDGDVAVVGAYRDWSGEDRGGSVFVYRFDGSVWAEEANLIPTDLTPTAEFGISVGVSGDTLVVGSHLDDEGGPDAVGFAVVDALFIHDLCLAVAKHRVWCGGLMHRLWSVVGTWGEQLLHRDGCPSGVGSVCRRWKSMEWSYH